MATKFNAFTGNFDLTGSGGGGGASYIDGEVAVFNDLPVTVGTPAVNSAYLVRGAQGVWPVSYKPGGIYARTGNAGTLADWTYSGVFPDVFSDAQFLIYDDADTSKNAQFSAASISTGTTRTYTLPNANGTLMLNTLNLSSLTDLPTARTNLGLGSGDSPTFTNLTLSRGTITTSSPVSITQTWNAGAVTFTALDVNVTNTASAAASALADFRVGSTRQLAILRAGEIQWNTTNTPALVPVANGFNFRLFTSSNIVSFGNPYVSIGNGAYFGFSSAGDASDPANHDIRLYRNGTRTAAFYNSTNAMALQIFGTRTDASNGRWLSISSTTAGVFSITPTGNGTGASGNLLHISGLPTSNPGAGILWNDAGTVKVGT